jgi:hypothetical protein
MKAVLPLLAKMERLRLAEATEIKEIFGMSSLILYPKILPLKTNQIIMANTKGQVLIMIK